MPKKKNADGTAAAEKTYTAAEVAKLIAKATGDDDIDAIAKREYHVIVADDGQILAYPPGDSKGSVKGFNGPIALNGEHPDDYYGVEEQDDGKGGKKYVATQNV